MVQTSSVAGLLPLGSGAYLSSKMAVTQITEGDCADGVCGPQTGTPRSRPCAPASSSSGPVTPYSVLLTSTEIDGFFRLEQ